MKPKRVLVVGGATRSLMVHRGSLIEALSKRGHRVTCLSDVYDKAVADWLHGLGGELHTVSLRRTGICPFGDLSYLSNLRRKLSEIPADTILAYTHKPVVYTGIARRTINAGTDTVALITGLGYAFGAGVEVRRRIAKYFATFLYRQASRGITRWIFQNQDDHDLFRSRSITPAKKPTLIVNGSGVDLSHFKSHGIDPAGFRVLLVSRMLVEKGVVDLVEAIIELRRRGRQCSCVLVGPVDENPSSIPPSVIAKWVQDGIVQYHGSMTDVRPLLRDCTVFVLPSYYREGVPRVILEAMATGRPIITTDTPGCRLTIENALPVPGAVTIAKGKNGYIVAASNSASIVEALEHLRASPQLITAMGSASREYAEREFDAEKINTSMLEFCRL